MRVLGVDPGLTRCGVGVVDGSPGRRLTLVHVEVIRTPADADLAHRLLGIEQALELVLDAVQPDAVAVERVFSQHNVRTVMGTAQAGAVAITCAARRGIPVVLHTPSEVKAAVTGSGRADKDQVGVMVARLLGIAEALEGWLDQVRPDVVAVERVFSQHNVRTVMGTAQAAGVAVLAAARRGIPVAVHTPSEVKASVTGDGRAGKKQVAAMVTRILGLPDVPRPADAADALALAICHLWRDGTSASVAAGLPGAPTAAQRRWIEAAEAARRTARLPGVVGGGR